jgi:hypothetical protein
VQSFIRAIRAGESDQLTLMIPPRGSSSLHHAALTVHESADVDWQVDGRPMRPDLIHRLSSATTSSTAFGFRSITRSSTLAAGSGALLPAFQRADGDAEAAGEFP